MLYPVNLVLWIRVEESWMARSDMNHRNNPCLCDLPLPFGSPSISSDLLHKWCPAHNVMTNAKNFKGVILAIFVTMNTRPCHVFLLLSNIFLFSKCNSSKLIWETIESNCRLAALLQNIRWHLLADKESSKEIQSTLCPIARAHVPIAEQKRKKCKTMESQSKRCQLYGHMCF